MKTDCTLTRHLARVLPALLAVTTILLLLLAGISRASRIPKYEGKTLVEWLDAMDVPLVATNSARITSHKTSQVISNLGPGAIPLLQEVVKHSFGKEDQSQEAFLRRAKIWALINRISPSMNPLQPPGMDLTNRAQLNARMIIGTYYILKLSPDIPSGIDNIASFLGAHQHPRGLSLSAAFSAIQDHNQQYTMALSNQVLRSSGNRRAFWVSCLGHLGPQAVGAADLVRKDTDDPHPAVRDHAIQALACIAPVESTFNLLEQHTENLDDRRSVMLALLRIGTLARPAEALIRRTLKDPDMWTSMYAQWALRNLELATNSSRSTNATTTH